MISIKGCGAGKRTAGSGGRGKPRGGRRGTWKGAGAVTLTQLKYVIAVAEKGTFSEAAKELFLSQPSLTNAVKELEQEIGVTIFQRTNRGITVSREGAEFLGYARQVVEQTSLLEEKYLGKQAGRRRFCISTQHYSFAVEAFVELLRLCGGEEYGFSLRETQTYEIMEDVSRLRSEVGILYLNRFNETILRKTLKEYGLEFYSLFRTRPHVFVSTSNPLARQASVTLEDLEPFPRLSYEQGEHNSFYFSEEILSTLDHRKDIQVRDRATLFNLLIGLNGYTICSGVISEALNGSNIVAIPLAVDDEMNIGYILHRQTTPGYLAAQYIAILKEHVRQLKGADPED